MLLIQLQDGKLAIVWPDRRLPVPCPVHPDHPILAKVRAVNPDVLGISTNALDDGLAIIRQMKALDVNPRMLWGSVGLSLPKLHEVLGRDVEYLYGMGELVALTSSRSRAAAATPSAFR